ncbi:MAG TPA: hypothetical protein VGP48_08660 [Stellaceae bacterium]|jgi:hypothetical protein|nr:hypothetical protein [Stellaceae bacterium]
MMEDLHYWRLRAAEMRIRAAQIKDPFISGGFRTLAAQYEQLAADGARWLRARRSPSQAAASVQTPH